MTDPVTPWLVAFTAFGAVVGAVVLAWIIHEATTGGLSFPAGARSARAHQATLPNQSGPPCEGKPAGAVNARQPADAAPAAPASNAGKAPHDRILPGPDR